MSFILDALKRAEQERAGNDLNPAIAVDIVDTKDDRHRRFPWLVILILAILLMLAAAWFLFMQRSSDPAVAEQAQKQATPAVMPAEEAMAPVIMPEQQTAKAASQPVAETDVPSTPVVSKPAVIEPPPPLAQQAQKKPAKKPSVNTKKEPLPKPAAVPEAASSSPSPAEESRESVPTIRELPDADQNLLSGYEINTHFYSSKPGRSFALINMKKYRVGDVIDGTQLKIEQITPRGVIIDYGKGSVLLNAQ